MIPEIPKLRESGHCNCVTIHKALLQFDIDIPNSNDCYIIKCEQGQKCSSKYDCKKWHFTEDHQIGIVMKKIKVWFFFCLFLLL